MTLKQNINQAPEPKTPKPVYVIKFEYDNGKITYTESKI
jgi:hypothetical protein